MGKRSIGSSCILPTKAGAYPIIIIERFHSFAHIADDAMLSMLSCMRSLEHSRSLTTIALSPVDYDVIRREISAALPFVNSAYGDNHDRVVMAPLSNDEFLREALSRGVNANDADALFKLGGGPDCIYEALIDESISGFLNIENRCADRVDVKVQRFLSYAIGSGSEYAALLMRLASESLEEADVEFLARRPQCSFILDRAHNRLRVKGAIIRIVIERDIELRRLVKVEVTRDQMPSVKLLLVSANSTTSPLDLEIEIRNLQRELLGGVFRDRIFVTNCLGATPDDLVRHLRTHKPDVVHFLGHGNRIGVELRSDDGLSQLVTGRNLARLFKGRSVKMVVFNVCESASYSKAVLAYVKVVVSTTDAVDDLAAIRFSSTFYRTIVGGHSVGEAFDDASNSIKLNNFENVFKLVGDRNLHLLQ